LNIPFGLIEVGARILERVIPDRDAREKAQAELLRAAQDQDFALALAQIEVNREEAQSTNWWVAGWRPAVGWVCVVGLFYNFLLYPMLTWAVAVWQLGFEPPPLLSDNLMELVLGMLGLGALRTAEKWKGVAR
jgi:hypothetical protein